MLTQETGERGRKGEGIRAEVYNSLHQEFYIKKFIPKSLY